MSPAEDRTRGSNELRLRASAREQAQLVIGAAIGVSSRAALRVGVIGVGHLGKEHARVYAQMPGARLCWVADADPARAREIGARWGVSGHADFAPHLAEVQAVSVATPTRFHLEVAQACLEAGCHVLVEKPMTRTLDEARTLVQAAERAGRVLQVGHVERFNPAVMAALEIIDRPRFITCDRISPFKFRSADIGVVHDLMIHDIDVILHLVPEPIREVRAMGVAVLGQAEDIAHAYIVFEGGCVANVTASRVALKQMRKIRLFQADAYISLDYHAQTAQVFRRKSDFDAGRIDLTEIDAAGMDDPMAYVFTHFLDMQQIDMEKHEPLAEELTSFVRAARDGQEPVVSGRHGLRAMEAAQMIIDAMPR